jgi:hypothetical protein
MTRDAVNRPPHYNAGGIEGIDAIEAWGLGFHLGNVVKYVARAQHKGSTIEDLEKAAWYLRRHIDNLKCQRDERDRAARERHEKGAST